MLISCSDQVFDWRTWTTGEFSVGLRLATSLVSQTVARASNAHTNQDGPYHHSCRLATWPIWCTLSNVGDHRVTRWHLQSSPLTPPRSEIRTSLKAPRYDWLVPQPRPGSPSSLTGERLQKEGWGGSQDFAYRRSGTARLVGRVCWQVPQESWWVEGSMYVTSSKTSS